jgi:hypothetical protein
MEDEVKTAKRIATPTPKTTTAGAPPPAPEAPATPEESALVQQYKQDPAYKDRTEAQILKAIRKQTKK